MKRKLLAVFLVIVASLCMYGCDVNTSKVQVETDHNSDADEVEEVTDWLEEEEPTEKEAVFKEINSDSKIKTDFVKIKLKGAYETQALYPSDTSSVYSYIPDKKGEKYICLKGTIKNIGGDAYSVEEMKIQMTFDDKYNYSGTLAADGGSDFYGDYLDPYNKTTFYIYASVPEEVLKKSSEIRIRFAFNENFDSTYGDEFEEYEYCYETYLAN